MNEAYTIITYKISPLAIYLRVKRTINSRSLDKAENDNKTSNISVVKRKTSEQRERAKKTRTRQTNDESLMPKPTKRENTEIKQTALFNDGMKGFFFSLYFGTGVDLKTLIRFYSTQNTVSVAMYLHLQSHKTNGTHNKNGNK